MSKLYGTLSLQIARHFEPCRVATSRRRRWHASTVDREAAFHANELSGWGLVGLRHPPNLHNWRKWVVGPSGQWLQLCLQGHGELKIGGQFMEKLTA